MKINIRQFDTNAYASLYMRLYWRQLEWNKTCWKNLAKAIVRIAKETGFSIKQITYKEVVLWLASKKLQRTGKTEDLQEYQELRELYR
ncbi:MAG: hypothetical protein WC356_02940 [Candidatus Micrarchaeia archaeon]|jgi:hypothetical protein